jgi:hypothetical protein
MQVSYYRDVAATVYGPQHNYLLFYGRSNPKNWLSEREGHHLPVGTFHMRCFNCESDFN